MIDILYHVFKTYMWLRLNRYQGGGGTSGHHLHVTYIDVTLMSYKITKMGNSYVESEADVIAVKIQVFKRIPTSYLSYHP